KQGQEAGIGVQCTGKNKSVGTGRDLSDNFYKDLINSSNLTGLTSKQAWDKQIYYKEYQKSFKDGEYNLQEPVHTAYVQTIRSYFSGGISFDSGAISSAITARIMPANQRRDFKMNPFSDTYLIFVSLAYKDKIINFLEIKLPFVPSIGNNLESEEENKVRLVSSGINGRKKKQKSEVKKMPFRGELLALDSKDLLLYSGAAIFYKLNDLNPEICQSSIQTIGDIVKTNPGLIIKEMVNLLFYKLNDGYWGVRQSAAQAIGEIAKTRSKLITVKIVNRLFERLSDENLEVLQSVAQAIGEITKVKFVLIKEIADRFFERLSDENLEVRQSVAQAIGEIAKTGSELITAEIVKRLYDRLNDVNREVCQVVMQAIGEIAKTRSELITAEIVKRLYDKLNDKHWQVYRSATQAIGEIAKTRSELITAEIVKRLYDRLNDVNREVCQVVMQAIGEIAKTRSELITAEIVNLLFDKLNDHYIGVRQSAAQAVVEIAKVKLALMKETIWGLFQTLNYAHLEVRQAVTQILGEIAKTNRELITTEVVNCLFDRVNDINLEVRQSAAQAIGEIAKTKSELIISGIVNRLYDRLNDVNGKVCQTAIDAIGEIAKTSPELITAEIVKRLYDRLNDGYWYVRRSATQAIGEIAKTGSELITAEIAKRLYDRLNDVNGKVCQVAIHVVGEIIFKSSVDLIKINYYKKELLNPTGEFRLTEEYLLEGYLVTSFFLEEKEDFGLWLDFKDRSEQDFRQLTVLLASNIMWGAAEEAIAVLKENHNIKETILSLEELLLRKAGFNFYVPTRSWNNLQKWFNFYNRFFYIPPEKAIAHIIITMKLLQTGIGEQVGFRAVTDVENRLPEIRQCLSLLMNKPVSLLTKRRLIKAIALGSPDQIERLRNQAIDLAVVVTGRDTRMGLVGRIRDRIHNQPSPQDLAVVKAYRIFIDREDASGLRKTGYNIDISDKISDSRRQRVLLACDNLITSLEDIYGEGSINSIEEYFRLWKNAIPGQEDLKTIISILFSKMSASDSSYLEDIVKIRQDLYTLFKDLRGEELLLTILLDNRMEILFYRQFNAVREGINFDSFQEAVKAINILLLNTRLNGYCPEELSIICNELNFLVQEKIFNKEDWLRLYFIYKRIERIINQSSYSAIDEFQQMSERLAAAIGVTQNLWVDNFSSNIFRSDTIYLLSLVLKDAKKAAMQKANISGWQVVVEGEAEGQVKFINNISDLKSVGSDDIIVIERLPSESPPITEAAAIITLTEDSLLSHPAIRAREYNIPFAVCPDIALLDGFDGQWVKFVVKEEEIVLIKKRKELVDNNGSPQSLDKKQINIIPADLTDGKIVIMPEDYQPAKVGNKSFNLQQIPVDLLLEQVSLRHFNVSFSFFKQVLDSEANAEIKARLLKLKTKALKNPSAANITDTLKQMRLLIEELKIPDDYIGVILETIEKVFGDDKSVTLFLRSSTNAEDLAGYQAAGLYDSFGNIRPEAEEISKYIKKIWASVWNARAFFDRQANGIDHNAIFSAILIQEMIVPDYAFVIHTQNPNGVNRNELVIELVQGLGESLVSGTEEFSGSPYRFIYNRSTGELFLKVFANKSKKLILENGELKESFVSYRDDRLLTSESLEFIRRVVEAAVKIEEEFNSPQDIEGVVLNQEIPWRVAFLQSRKQSLNSNNQTGIQQKKEPLSPASSGIYIPTISSSMQKAVRDFGGIDFSYLPIVTQAKSNLNVNITNSSINKFSRINFDTELFEIKNLVRSGIIPSVERIKEYIQASCYHGRVDRDMDSVRSCISDILRLEEEQCVSTEPMLKDMLVVIESVNSVQQLKAVFLGIRS
ncbi:MAG: sister chromatid cohesion protein PDS5, partial [Candidatus Omnitrophota bacterium]